MKEKNKGRKKTTSCGGLVWRLREGQVEVLLIKQFAHKERWGIPKGHVDKGETLEECAVREIREEAGVNVKLGLRLQDAFIKNDAEDKTVVSWLAEPVGSHEPNHNDPDSEVADARWFNVAQLPEIMVYQRPLIASAVNAVFELLENGNKVKPT
jgi:8-oxo-dGTP diphosphatase